MLDDEQLSTEQQEAVLGFVETVKRCQAIQWVGIVKQDDKGARYQTGGYKGVGPTMLDMSRSLGALAYDLVVGIVEHARSKGTEISLQEAGEAVGTAIQAGLDAARAYSGHMKIVDDDTHAGPRKRQDPGSAPRGF